MSSLDCFKYKALFEPYCVYLFIPYLCLQCFRGRTEQLEQRSQRPWGWNIYSLTFYRQRLLTTGPEWSSLCCLQRIGSRAMEAIYVPMVARNISASSRTCKPCLDCSRYLMQYQCYTNSYCVENNDKNNPCTCSVQRQVLLPNSFISGNLNPKRKTNGHIKQLYLKWMQRSWV